MIDVSMMTMNWAVAIRPRAHQRRRAVRSAADEATEVMALP